MAVQLHDGRTLVIRLAREAPISISMEKTFRDEILHGVSSLKATVQLDVGTFEDEGAFGQLLTDPILDHGVLEPLEGLDIHSVSITNLIQGLKWV